MKKFVWIALILTVWLSYGCVPWPPGYFPTPTQTGSTPIPDSQTSAPIAFTATRPLPSLTPTQAGQPTPTPQLLTPLVSGENIMQLDWSSDGQWLAFLTQSAQEAASIPPEGYTGPITGTLNIYNILTKQSCAYPMDNPHRLKLNAWHAWLPDDRLATLDDHNQVLALQPPCSGQIAPVSARERLSLQPYDPTYPDQTYSPDGSYRGFNLQDQNQYKTIVEKGGTDDLVAAIDWSYSGGGLGSPPGPVWLSDQQFILPRTDAGPLLVTVAQKPQIAPIAPNYFQLNGSASQLASGLLTPDLHLLLTDFGVDSSHADVRLYHGETDQVEKLLYSFGAFAPGEKTIILGNDAGERWMRSLDPPDSPMIKFIETSDQLFPAWSPDGARVAVASRPAVNQPVTIRVLEAPTGTVLYTWSLSGLYGTYNYTQLAWSPGLQYLASVGSDLNNPQERAIFLFDFPAGLRPPISTPGG
jgi:WD40 repeat protein